MKHWADSRVVFALTVPQGTCGIRMTFEPPSNMAEARKIARAISQASLDEFREHFARLTAEGLRRTRRRA